MSGSHDAASRAHLSYGSAATRPAHPHLRLKYIVVHSPMLALFAMSVAIRLILSRRRHHSRGKLHYLMVQDEFHRS